MSIKYTVVKYHNPQGEEDAVYYRPRAIKTDDYTAEQLERDINDATIGEFYRQLKYKCEWYGVNYIEVGRFEPTSKSCSVCGWKYKDLKLHQRSWVCPECGAHHDRDMNAAINIREFGLKALRMERAEVKPVVCRRQR